MELTLSPIFPISALQKRQREVKEAARDDVVRITENGSGAYVFCSEAAFKRALAEAAEEAAYEARMEAVILRGKADIAAGRFIEGTDAARAEVERRLNRG